MRKEIVNCDKCGKEIEKSEFTSLRIKPTSRAFNDNDYIHDTLDLDLCPECMKEFLGMVNIKPEFFEERC